MLNVFLRVHNLNKTMEKWSIYIINIPASKIITQTQSIASFECYYIFIKGSRTPKNLSSQIKRTYVCSCSLPSSVVLLVVIVERKLCFSIMAPLYNLVNECCWNYFKRKHKIITHKNRDKHKPMLQESKTLIKQFLQ